MRKTAASTVSLVAACLLLVSTAGARKPQSPVAWVYVQTENAPILRRPRDTKAKQGDLSHGSLAELVEEKTVKAETWDKVQAVNPATLLPLEGWTEGARLARIPYNRYPADADLLAKMGQPFLDDFVAEHTVIARFLVRQGGQEPLLVCYTGSRVLPEVRLQVFREVNGKWTAGAFLEFPFADMNSGVKALEIRDLLGDHYECLVSTEKVQSGAGTSLTRMVIRRVEDNSVQTLWEAPLKLSALGSYPAKTHVLEPPFRNIGRPGTVTTGKVAFQPQGGITEPVWQGKVEFFVIGKDKPVDTIFFRKACRWTGSSFEPLQSP